MLVVPINIISVQAQSYGCNPYPDCNPYHLTLDQALAEARASANNTNSTSSSPQTTKLSTSEICSSKMTGEAHSIASSLNNTKAISLAESSNEFKSKIQGYTISSSPSVYEEWTLNSTACTVTLKDVGVAFFLNDSKSSAKTMQVTLDPSLTIILNVVVRDSVWYGQSANGISTVPEFPFAEIMLVCSIVSVIFLYQLKFKIKI